MVVTILEARNRQAVQTQVHQAIACGSNDPWPNHRQKQRSANLSGCKLTRGKWHWSCDVQREYGPSGKLWGKVKAGYGSGRAHKIPEFLVLKCHENLPLFTLYLCHTVTSICWWLRTSHEWKRDGAATLESASILRSAPYWPSWPKQRPDWGGRFDMFDVWLRLLRFYLFILWKCAPPSMQVASRYSILFAKENLHNFSLAAVRSSHEGLGEPQPRRAARQGLCWKIRWGQSCQQGACRGQSSRKSARGQGGCGQSGISGCSSWALAGEVWPGNREGGAMERPGRMDQRLGPYGGDLGLGEGWSEIFFLLIFPFADRTSST